MSSKSDGDYLKYYDLEKYLLEEVGPKFRVDGSLQPTDLFMIFIWKANRAKTKLRDKLRSQARGSFEEAANQFAKDIFNAGDRSERLRVLIEKWKLQLPMASAVLTILFPEEFTVYDYRTRETKGIPSCSSTKFPKLWTEYEQYLAAVKEATPQGLSLRDKDRYLWAKSLRTHAIEDAGK